MEFGDYKGGNENQKSFMTMREKSTENQREKVEQWESNKKKDENAGENIEMADNHGERKNCTTKN
jgi:hypothetical protein